MAALAGQVRSEQHETTKKGTLYCLKMNIVRLLVDNFSLVCLYLLYLGTPLNLKRAMNMVYYTMRIEFIKKYQTVPPIDVNR